MHHSHLWLTSMMTPFPMFTKGHQPPSPTAPCLRLSGCPRSASSPSRPAERTRAVVWSRTTANLPFPPRLSLGVLVPRQARWFCWWRHKSRSTALSWVGSRFTRLGRGRRLRTLVSGAPGTQIGVCSPQTVATSFHLRDEVTQPRTGRVQHDRVCPASARRTCFIGPRPFPLQGPSAPEGPPTAPGCWEGPVVGGGPSRCLHVHGSPSLAVAVATGRRDSDRRPRHFM